MKTSILLLGTASLIFTAGAGAQSPPVVKPAPGAPATTTTAPAKPKPFVSSDTRIYITLAETMQFQLKASDRLRGTSSPSPRKPAGTSPHSSRPA